MGQINHQYNTQSDTPLYMWHTFEYCAYEMKNGQDNYEMTQGLITSTVRAMKAQDVLHHETQV